MDKKENLLEELNYDLTLATANVEQFQENAQKSPSYAIGWNATDAIIGEYLMREIPKVVKWIEESWDNEEFELYINMEIEWLEDDLMKSFSWDSNSTCEWSNAKNRAESKGKAKLRKLLQTVLHYHE